MSPGLNELARGYTEGAIFTFWLSAKEKDPAKTVINDFKTKEGRMPFVDLFAFPTYDAVQSVAFAIANSDGDDIDSFEKSLKNVHGLNGTTGIVNFADDGTARIPFRLFKLVNGNPMEMQ